MVHSERHRTEHIGWLRAGVVGATAARLGGAPVLRGALRVVFWGAVAMLCTSLVGKRFGTTM